MRAKNVAKNSFFSVFSQLLIILAGFFSQRVINLRLGTELVGLNGVISNVIMVFSVSELGISTAVVFHLYKALAQEDENKIAGLMNLYRRAYYVVAGVIAVLGLSFLPFIHLLMRDNHFSAWFIRLVYGLWLVRSVLGYILSYKRSILIADQKEYVNTLAAMAVSIFNYMSVIVLVLLFDDYVLALLLGIIFEVITNLFLIRFVDQHYPYLKRNRNLRLDGESRSRIFGDIKNLFITRVAQKILGSTDNLIMSGFISLSIVGFYSNYCLITQSLINIMQALSGALQPTIGNLAVENNRERDEELLQSITFVFFLLSSVIMCGVAGMATVFVSDIWLGKDFSLSAGIVFLCAMNCMFYIMLLPIGMFTSVSGLFWQEKWVSLFAAVLNLLLSLLLVAKLEITGVLIGTTSAYFVLGVGKTYFYYRDFLGRKMGGYLKCIAGYLLLSSAEALGVQKLVHLIYGEGNPGRFILSGAVCVLLPLGVNLLLFIRSHLLRQTIEFIKSYKKLSKKGHEEV